MQSSAGPSHHGAGSSAANSPAYSSFSHSNKMDDLEFPYCPDSNKYERLAKIGQGTFG